MSRSKQIAEPDPSHKGVIIDCIQFPSFKFGTFPTSMFGTFPTLKFGTFPI